MDGSDAKPTLAEAVTWLSTCEALPRDVEAKARLLLLDTFGCLMAGLVHPEVQKFGQALRLAFPGDAAATGPDAARYGARKNIGTKSMRETLATQRPQSSGTVQC